MTTSASAGREFFQRMMDWEFEPPADALPPQWNDDLPLGFSDLSWHYKDLYEDGTERPIRVAKHGTHDQRSHGNWARTDSIFGSNDLSTIFPDSAPRGRVPWPTAGRRRDRKDYDLALVQKVMREPVRLEPVDPRTLSARQAFVTREGVQYYLTNEFAETGSTYADPGSAINKFPTIYMREDGTNMILSGHHRAAAALIKGEMLQARVVRGPWPSR